MELSRLYPLTFEPLLKEIIWGGAGYPPIQGIGTLRAEDW